MKMSPTTITPSDSENTIKNVDEGVKNKFRWNWLEEKDSNGDFLSDYVRKISAPGKSCTGHLSVCLSLPTGCHAGNTGMRGMHLLYSDIILTVNFLTS